MSIGSSKESLLVSLRQVVGDNSPSSARNVGPKSYVVKFNCTAGFLTVPVHGELNTVKEIFNDVTMGNTALVVTVKAPEDRVEVITSKAAGP